MNIELIIICNYKQFANRKIKLAWLDYKKIRADGFICVLTPGITEKKVPPKHQSRYIGSSLDVVYKKLKVVEAPITSAIESWKVIFLHQLF